MREERIAHRYARALILATREDSVLAKVESDLSTLLLFFNEPSSGFRRLIENPTFSTVERKRVVAQISQKFAFQPMTQKLLDLLIDRDRARFIPAIANAFAHELDNRFARVRASITTAKALHDTDLRMIVSALQARVGKSVIAESHVDASVLGGVRAKIGGLIFDRTLQTQLDNLKKTLISSSMPT